MKTSDKKLLSLVIRYSLIVFLGLGNLYLVYSFFTPLTLQGSKFLLSFFGKTVLITNIVLFKAKAIELIPACIAGAAYYLLFLLNLSVRDLKVYTRIKAIVFSLGLFYLINIIRITIFSMVSQQVFDKYHLFTWYVLSVVLVILIWFLTVKLFKIKSVPIYDDLVYLMKQTKKSKRTKKNKKTGKKHPKSN